MILAQLNVSLKGRNVFMSGPWLFCHSNLLSHILCWNFCSWYLFV